VADTGAISAGTLADDATVGTVTWTNPSNVASSNNVYAEANVSASLDTIDSYSETNQDSLFISYPGNYQYYGQAFANTSAIILNEAQFYLRKSGTPTGNINAYIYAHTGTYGSDGLPTGTALAVSDNFDISTLTTSLALTTFTFSGDNQIQLAASTKYFVVVKAVGDSSNYLAIGYDASSASHGGTAARSDDASSWNGLAGDICFYVKGKVRKITHYLKATNFGFAIPAGSTINGIKAEIESALDPGSVAIESAIRIVKADGSISTTNKSIGVTVPSSDTYVVYGGASDVWGESWSSTNINDADFGVVVSYTGTQGIVLIDHIRMTVYYTLGGGGAFFQMF